MPFVLLPGHLLLAAAGDKPKLTGPFQRQCSTPVLLQVSKNVFKNARKTVSSMIKN